MSKTGGHQAGFTLIEAIIVIVITGIVSAIVAVFIKTSIDSYVASERRAELTEAADVALRRMAREVRLSVPNSLRLVDSGGAVGSCTTANRTCYIEFVPTKDGGRYRDAGDGSTAGNALDFTNAANKTFDVLGTSPANPPNVAANDYIVVYNLGTGYDPANIYSGGNRAQVNGVTAGTPYSVTLTTNIYPSESPPLPSPNSRFHVVDGTTRAVTYACTTTASTSMIRYSNYAGGGFNASQTTTLPPGGTQNTVVNGATCSVDYLPTAEQRNGILYVTLTLTDTQGSGETVTVFEQIHVDNSP